MPPPAAKQPVATKAVVRVHESRLKKKKHGGGGHGGGASAERWLLTYADMITLLLALFIILFAISTPNKVKYEQLVKAMSGGFGGESPINTPTAGAKDGAQVKGRMMPVKASAAEAKAAEQKRLAQQVKAIQVKLSKLIEQRRLKQQVKVHMEARGLVISLLTDHATYNSGSAALRPGTLDLLHHIAGFLTHIDNEIRIEGNTDNIPIATAEYPSNWELSSARAIVVTRFLIEQEHLDPRRLSAAGYGQFKPQVDNSTEAHRQLNRRVDVVVLNTRPDEEKSR